MKLSQIIAQKYFNGDIIIADPMYFIDKELRSPNLSKPKWEDYFPHTQYTPEMLEDPNIAKEYNYCRPKYQDAYNDWMQSQISDWEKSDYGNDLEQLGFNSFIVMPSEYGCWSCTVYDEMAEEIQRGKFYSDSGLFGIFHYNDVKNYNQQFKRKIKGIAYINGFMGQIYVVNLTGLNRCDADVRVIGVGTKNFHTRQTGF